jgi:hypothetical protein
MLYIPNESTCKDEHFGIKNGKNMVSPLTWFSYSTLQFSNYMYVII